MEAELAVLEWLEVAAPDSTGLEAGPAAPEDEVEAPVGLEAGLVGLEVAALDSPGLEAELAALLEAPSHCRQTV